MGMEQYTTAVLSAYLTGLRHPYYITVACAAAAFCSVLGLSWINIKKVGAREAEPASETSPVDTAEKGAQDSSL